MPLTEPVSYAFLVVPALALIVWQLVPNHSWPWLLLAGAIGSLPWVIGQFDPEIYGSWLGYALVVLAGSAPVFTLVGIMGAGTWLWLAGKRAAAAALMGTAPAIQLVGPLVLLSTFSQGAGLYEIFGVIFAITGVLGAVGVVVVVWGRGGRISLLIPRPSWRLTLIGGLAAMSGLLSLIWRPEVTRYAGSSTGDSISRQPLYLGLAFLAVGLLAGAFVGVRALLGALAVGLLLGASGMIIGPAAKDVSNDETAVLVTVVVLVAVAIAVVAALSRWRMHIGIAGMAIVQLGLLVLVVLFSNDSVDANDPVILVAAPVLLPIGLIAAVALMAEIGFALAARAEAAAVFVGLATTFSSGVIAITAFFAANPPADMAPSVGLLPPVMVSFLLAAVVTAVVSGLRARPSKNLPVSPTDPT